MDWRWGSIIPVWGLALVGAVVIAATPAREQFWTWIPVGFGLSVVVAFALQIATRRPEGFVHRAVAAIVGSLGIFVAATVLLALFG